MSLSELGYWSHISGEPAGQMAGPSFRDFSLVVTFIFPIVF